jgi:UDP-N-acetylmuramyl pentapeptide synthase
LSSILEQDTPFSPPLEGGVLKTPENQNTEMSVSALVLNKLNNSYKYFVAEM